MRWGISDQMNSIDVCIEEIERCYANSYGPAFVSCLSQRYGSKWYMRNKYNINTMIYC